MLVGLKIFMANKKKLIVTKIVHNLDEPSL